MSRKRFRLSFFCICTVIAVIAAPSLTSRAAAGPLDGSFVLVMSSRFKLYIEKENGQDSAHALGEKTLALLESIHGEVSETLSEPGAESPPVVLRLLSSNSFYRLTNAPKWTSAMYRSGEITVPVDDPTISSSDGFARTLRHEYAHAVIARLSDFNCPAWLDEGIAQLIEGDYSPKMVRALQRWIQTHDAIPFGSLERGFIRLSTDEARVAYGQSLFAVHELVRRYGMPEIRRYLERLKYSTDWRPAFVDHFGLTVDEFEKQLTDEMRTWAASGSKTLPLARMKFVLVSH